jgi:hypothetical protein
MNQFTDGSVGELERELGGLDIKGEDDAVWPLDEVVALNDLRLLGHTPDKYNTQLSPVLNKENIHRKSHSNNPSPSTQSEEKYQLMSLEVGGACSRSCRKTRE